MPRCHSAILNNIPEQGGKVDNGQEQRTALDLRLSACDTDLRPDDLMAEAGRKVLLEEFRHVLAHEAGSRNGTDIEDLHKLRVAIRKSRSALRLLRPYFRSNVTRGYGQVMRDVMRAAGPVRDLDVLLENLGNCDTSQQAALEQSLTTLQRQRTSARGKLLFVLYSDAWEQFLPSYVDFLTTPGAGVTRMRKDRIAPQLVCHVLPPLVYGRLAQVRAYGPAVADADSETLHNLRIDCKRLRYVVALFTDLLGPEILVYIAALKQMQDLLGRMNDIAVAQALLARLIPGQKKAARPALRSYLEAQAEERTQLLAQLPAVWEHFNSRDVQRELAAALLAL